MWFIINQLDLNFMYVKKTILHTFSMGCLAVVVILFFLKVYTLWILLLLTLLPIALRTYEIQKGYYVPKKGEMPMKILMLLVLGGMYVYFRYWAPL